MPLSKKQNIQLWVAIKDNLSKYPESKILRELIQNAEDAGADKVIVKLDTSSYSCSNLLKDSETGLVYEKSSDLQGPSLLIYNNQVFKEKDWEGIESIGIGSKKKDLKSYGCFGLGFNSSYHVTNKPQIISGLIYNFLDAEDRKHCEGHFEPFTSFKEANCTMDSYFNGTIIRLPLRSEPCKIKSKPLEIEDLKTVLNEFIQEVSEIPIFLKRIASIKVLSDNDVIANVSVTNYSEIREQREKVHLFLSNVIDNEMNVGGDDQTTSDITKFTNILNGKNQLDCQSTYKMDLKIELNNQPTKFISYVVSQGIFIDPRLIELVQDYEGKLISYGGAAVPIITCGGQQTEQFKGKPFTFLPIGSLIYDIPLHVNGYFQLSDARNEIKYYSSTDRKTSQEYQSKQWNHFITKSIIPYFYLQALEYMKSIENGTTGLYSYFPFKRNQASLANTIPEVDISINTMDKIVTGSYFKDIFNQNEYRSLSDSLIIEDTTPDFIIDLLSERSFPTIKIPLELLNHLKSSNHYCNLKILSKEQLCTILKSHPLSTYSELVLNYLCDKSIINNGLLNGIHLLPIDQNNLTSSTLSNLIYRSFQQYQFNKFIFMNDQIYDLLNQLNINFNYHLKLSKLPINFQNNIINFTNYYKNISEINLLTFITYLNHHCQSNSTFTNEEMIIEVWSCLDTLNSQVKTLTIDNISNLPIIQFRSSLTTIGVSAYDSGKFLRYDSRLLSIEPILNKINIFMVKEGHSSNNLLTEDQLSTILRFLQVSSLVCLVGNEIDSIRMFLISLIVSILSPKLYSSAFFNLPIHPCIGNSNKQYTSILYNSTCVDYSEIDQYEINGIQLIKIDGFSKTHLLSLLPTTSIYNSASTLFSNYLIPNISKFEIDKSITIIQEFILRYYSTNDGLLNTLSWIPSDTGYFFPPSNFYKVTGIEKELLKYLEPNSIIHPSLESLYNRVAGFNPNSPISLLFEKIPTFLSTRIIDDEYELIYGIYLEFLEVNRLSPIVSVGQINKISNIKFIPTSKIETYDGFGANVFESKVSLSQSSLLKDKDISFTYKYPIKEIGWTSPLYEYLSNNGNESILYHWRKLNQLDFTKYQQSINVKSIFITLYKHLNQMIKNNKFSIGKIQEIKEIKVIYSNDQLVDIDKLILNRFNIVNSNTKFEPYYYNADINYCGTQFEKLFETLMVKKELQDQDYLNLILNIQQDYPENPVPLNVLDLVVTSINSIKSFNFLVGKDIKLPTNDNQLIQFDQVFYNNLPKSDQPLDIHLLHKDISENIASRHKVLTLSQYVQDEVAFGDDIDFGQEESLESRLKSILKDYKQEIFFGEMIQNSHDAGADKVTLMYDSNSLTDKFKLENPQKVERCIDFPNYLESSILVYNNSVFTEKDIANIKTMSGSYKGSDSSSIGQFGLGINSMYNFSDCPSILTGKYLLVFDPFVTHIEPSTKRLPGAKYPISKHKKYSDMFIPYQHLQQVFNFNLDNGEFNGTIIRLPIRKRITNERHISKSEWNEQSILKLFNDIISNNVENLMLFTSIKSIEIVKLKSGSPIVQSIIKVSKESKLLVSQPFEKMLLKIPVQVCEYSFSKLENNINQTNERYIVGQAIDNPSVSNTNCFPNNLVYKFLSKYSGNKRRPVGGIAFKLNDGISTTSSSPFKSKSFAWLPLKDTIINIPVHIHGSFSITTAREIVDTIRSMEFEIQDPLTHNLSVSDQQNESFLIYWNRLLVKEIILPVYLNTLILFKYNYILKQHNNGENIEKYYRYFYSLFPQKQIIISTLSDKPIEEKGCFQVLINEFYSLIERNSNLNLFLPCPGFENVGSGLNTVYTEFDFITNNQSVLKCISSLGFGINVIPRDSFQFNFNFISTKEHWISPILLTTIIKSKKLNQQIITIDDVCNLFKFFSDIPKCLLHNCELLVFTDGTRQFINASDSQYTKQFQLFNKEHELLNYGINNGFKFIDSKLSNTIRGINIEKNKWTEEINIYDLNFIDFYFDQLLPNFNLFSKEKNIQNLELLGNCFYVPDSFTVSNKSIDSGFTTDQIKRLKDSEIFPYTNDNVVDVEKTKKFAKISDLYGWKFKKYGFTLDYPDQNSDKWKAIHKHLGIKKEFDKIDVVKQFKRISSECYKVKPHNEQKQQQELDLIKKSRYLWKSSEIKNVFKELLDLYIVPYRESTIFGGLKKVQGALCLSKISNTATGSLYEKLYFSNKFISDEVDINYPDDYSRYDQELIFDNFINHLTNVPSWPKINGILDPRIFEYLKDICNGLNRFDSFTQDQIDRLLTTRGLPIEKTADEFSSFQNMVLSSSSKVSPYFNVLPNPFSTDYHSLFSKLGVKQLNVDTIINRLNQEIDNEYPNAHYSTLLFLYTILINNSNQLDNYQNIPIITSNQFFKPSNKVFHFDDLSIGQRINSNLGLIYKINESIEHNYEALGVNLLSNVIKEELIEFIPIHSNEEQFFNELFESQEFIALVKKLGIDKILNTRLQFGDVKTKLLFNGVNVTGKVESKSYYKDQILYFDHKLSKTKIINSLCDNVLGNRKHAQKLEHFIEGLLDTGFKQTTITSISHYNNNNNNNTNGNLIYFKEVSRKLFNSANCLFDNGYFTQSCYHYYISIEMSIKYKLESTNRKYNHCHKLTSLSNYLNDPNLPQITESMEQNRLALILNTEISQPDALEFKTIANSFQIN